MKQILLFRGSASSSTLWRRGGIRL